MKQLKKRGIENRRVSFRKSEKDNAAARPAKKRRSQETVRQKRKKGIEPKKFERKGT